MDPFSSALYPIYAYFLAQWTVVFEFTFYAAIGSQVLYIITFMLYWHLILKRNPEGSQIEGVDPKLNQNFWKTFIGKEILYVGIGLTCTFASVAMLTYSLLISGRMLRSGWKKGRKFIAILGWIISPIIISAALIYGIYDYFNAQQYTQEFIVVIIFLVIFLFKQYFTPIALSTVQYLTHFQQNIWNRISHAAHVAVLLVILILPSCSILFFTIRYPGPTIQTEWIPQPDGTNQSAIVIFPPGYQPGDSHPVLMMRTPYGALSILSGSQGLVNQYVIDDQCIMVLINMRGCFGSQGVFDAFQSEPQDGIVGINWIINQTWCDGRIASYGASAGAINQYIWQPNAPAGLDGAVMFVGTGDLYQHMFFPGGCIQQSLMENWLTAVGAMGSYATFLNNSLFDTFWQNMSLQMNNRYQSVNIPALHIGGWFDIFDQGTIDGFEDYNQANTSAANHQILIMGPWDHSWGDSARYQPSITFPANAGGANLVNDMQYAMLNQALLNQTIDWANQPRVYYYLMGDPNAPGSTTTFNIWKTASSWPVPAINQNWYFQPNGTLSIDTPTTQANLTYLYDPQTPVAELGGRTITDIVNGHLTMGDADQRSVEYNRADILHFNSTTLTSPVTITGDINATLLIASNCSDTDFTVKLMDMFPDGSMMYVGDGILKARYHDGFTSANFLAAEQPYTMNIDLESTAYTFCPGHQICVAISSSDYPEYAVNPNTNNTIISSVNSTAGGAINWTTTPFNIAQNTLICGAGSYITFPRTDLF